MRKNNHWRPNDFATFVNVCKTFGFHISNVIFEAQLVVTVSYRGRSVIFYPDGRVVGKARGETVELEPKVPDRWYAHLNFFVDQS